MGPDRRRLLERLIREITRSEAQAVEQASREQKRIGVVPPVLALREVAKHAAAMRARFTTMMHAHDIELTRVGGFGATLSTIRDLVADRIVDDERAYRTCLLDLRHGLDVVRLTREVAHTEELFGIIRWCDDWLRARRTLVARVEAQLAWFAETHAVALPRDSEDEAAIDEAVPSGTMIALLPDRHEQEDAAPEHRLELHPSRTP